MHPLIKAADCLVLDIGQVLLSYQPQQIAGALLPEDQQADALRYVFGGPEWVELDRGTLDNAQAAASICQNAAMRGKQAQVLSLLFAFPDQMQPLPLSRELADWKRQGKRLYALSNFHAQAYTRIRQLHPFFDLMDGLLISSHERLLKPDPAIYQLLFRRFNLTPAHCCFIDDTAANVEAGRRLGMPGLVYAGMQSLLDQTAG